MKFSHALRSACVSRSFCVLAILATLCLLLRWYVLTLVMPDYAPHTAQLIRGVYHLHSAWSHDAQRPVASFSRAAAQQDLQFLVFTEHNRDVALPESLDAVWLFSQPELSTTWGHVVALGANAPPLDAYTRGTAPLEGIHGAGGKAIIAHPFDKKRPWSQAPTQMDGLEVANFAASLRRRVVPYGLPWISALLSYPWRSDVALATLSDRDARAMALWDQQQAFDSIGFCASDGHGWLGADLDLRAWHLILDPLQVPALAELRPEQILAALRAGHFYCMAGWVAHPAALRFVGQTDAGTVSVGTRIPAETLRAFIIETQALTVGQTKIVLYRNGQPYTSTTQAHLRVSHPPAGYYRVEIHAHIPQLLGPSRWLPILYSNRITLS